MQINSHRQIPAAPYYVSGKAVYPPGAVVLYACQDKESARVIRRELAERGYKYSRISSYAPRFKPLLRKKSTYYLIGWM